MEKQIESPIKQDYQNKVTLLDYAGGDGHHCLSAWQSTSEELGIELPENVKDRVDFIFKYLCKQKKKKPSELLAFLAEHKHHTPFENSYILFHVTAEIASHIHSLKHRIAVPINTESKRYKEGVLDKMYLPDDWLKITVSEKSRAELSKNPILKAVGDTAGWDWYEMLYTWSDCGFSLYHHACDDLRPALGDARAKESARFFCGYNSQLTYTMSFNFRSFMHFQGLRNSDHAQREIRLIAQAMLAEVKKTGAFENSLKAFKY